MPQKYGKNKLNFIFSRLSEFSEDVSWMVVEVECGSGRMRGNNEGVGALGHDEAEERRK